MRDNQKSSLRRILLEKRDHTSGDLLDIAAEKICHKLDKIKIFKNATNIGLYYSIGSEIPTRTIINKLYNSNKTICLPKIRGDNLEFKKISDSSSLEMGSFDIMEPKERCVTINSLDVILVPSVGISYDGARLGYGHGFYDRYIEKNDLVTISPILEKQIVKNIPQTESDQLIDWIVTEHKIYNTIQYR